MSCPRQVLLDVARLHPSHLGAELHDVEWQLICAGVHLLDGGDDALALKRPGSQTVLGCSTERAVHLSSCA